MSRVLEPMTYEDLSQLQREENKGRSLTPCRPDLYKAMADLLTRIHQEYEREFARDPDSVMCEGANMRRKNAELLAKQVTKIRTVKICSKAVNGADGADVSLETLTPEEREFYNEILELSKRQLTMTDHLRGRKTVNTRIDEPIVAAKPEPVAVSIPSEEPAVTETVVEEAPVKEPLIEDAIVEESFDDIPEIEEPVIDEPEPEIVVTEEPVTIQKDSIVLRILEDLPPFVGPDRNYELHKEDVVTLPAPMAQALINSQKAVSINPAL